MCIEEKLEDLARKCSGIYPSEGTLVNISIEFAKIVGECSETINIEKHNKYVKFSTADGSYIMFISIEENKC